LEIVYGTLGSDVKKQFPVSPRRTIDGCCVSVRSLGDIRQTRLSSLCDKVPSGQFSHAVIVRSTNDGLFAFAATCIDEIIRSCAFGSLFQSWLPCRPLGCAHGSSWTPVISDWAQLGTLTLNPKSLSEVLSAHANKIVLESHKRRLKDILPRKPPIFMSHTSSGQDGTHEFCQRLNDKLQKKLLCTVWFDQQELDGPESIQEMQVGMSNASFFIICLTPLYLTRPNCLRELRWALDMCFPEELTESEKTEKQPTTQENSEPKKEPTKKMVVLPLHPAVSLQGCKGIINANGTIEANGVGHPADVFLPVDDRIQVQPTSFGHLKGHKLSREAITLLERLTQNCAFDADWIKLQPWCSDELGLDWAEQSVSWAEETPVEVDELLESSLSKILVCMATSHPSAQFKFFKYPYQNLVSSPPSLEYLVPSDVFAIRNCYPRSQIIFSDQELVSLVHIGLSDVEIMGCVEHGFGKLSAIETQTLDGRIVRNANPLDSTCRVTAHMSGVDFAEARKNWCKNNGIRGALDDKKRDPVLKRDPEHQYFCKALMMFEKAAEIIGPLITSEFESFHSELLDTVLNSKPDGVTESAWKQSDQSFEVWETLLLARHKNKEAIRREKFWVNVPDPDKNLVWSPSVGPHLIAKVYCAEGAKKQNRIKELDIAKLFNILQFCSRFPDNLRGAASHCNPCRNISAHTAQSVRKLSKQEYDSIYKCICQLLECVNDRPSHIAVSEIRALYVEQWQMIDYEVVDRMEKENERLRTQVMYLQGAKSSGTFSLKVLDSHLLTVFPNLSTPKRFSCMAKVITGPVEVGMDVAGSEVCAGKCLASASGVPDGFVSNLSISNAQEGKGDTKLQYTSQKFAQCGQDVLVEITIVADPHEFEFPSLKEEALCYANLVKKIEDARSSCSDAEATTRLKAIIAKLKEKPPKKLADLEVKFCIGICKLDPEESKLLPSNLPAPPAAVENDAGVLQKNDAGVRQRPKSDSKHGDSAKKESGGDGAKLSRSPKKDGSDDSSPPIIDVHAKAVWGGVVDSSNLHGSHKEQRSQALIRRIAIGGAFATVMLLTIGLFFSFRRP
jgi:hypothetical protein